MPNILTHLIGNAIARYGKDREAFSHVVLEEGNKHLAPVSWGEFGRKVEDLACALEILDLQEKDMVAVFAANCPEILITDFACYRNRVVPVSLYATSSPEQVKYIVKDSGTRMVFLGDEIQYRTYREVAADCGNVVKTVIYNRSVEIDNDDSDSIYFEDLLELGAMASRSCRDAVELRSASARPDDIATLIYTSGTTGEPKGAVLTHSNFNAAIDIHKDRLDMLSDEDTSLCFLPLSHIFEKAWTYFCLSMGMRVAINTNPKEIQDAIRLVRPSCMCSVPRFWEKVYTAVQEKIANSKGIQKIMIERALKVGAKYNLEYRRLGLKAPWWLEQKYRFYDKNVFSKLRHVIGIENGTLFPTAGAPLSGNIVEFLVACGIPMVIGYGLSETTATVSCFPSVGYTIGSVGTVLPDISVKIGENNEILVKGPTVMRGYYGREEDNKAAFTPDGYFRTGDAGRIDETGALVLTERLKDLFKTSNGKYIAPQAIESRLGEDRYIEQVAVIGDQRKYVTAIIIPAFEAIKEYAVKKHIQFTSIEDLVENSEIRKLIAERIERLQKGFAGFEKIKKFTLLPKEFTIESGELTNTLKIRRPVINSVYASQIEAMYC